MKPDPKVDVTRRRYPCGALAVGLSPLPYNCPNHGSACGREDALAVSQDRSLLQLQDQEEKDHSLLVVQPRTDTSNTTSPEERMATDVDRLNLQSVMAFTDQLKSENARLHAAIRWALGEEGEFGEEPPPLAGKYRRRYWWRGELRRRAFGEPQAPSDEGAV